MTEIEEKVEALLSEAHTRRYHLIQALDWHRENIVTGKLELRNPEGPEASRYIFELEADKAKMRGALQRIEVATRNEARAGDKGYVSRYGIHGIASKALQETER